MPHDSAAREQRQAAAALEQVDNIAALHEYVDRVLLLMNPEQRLGQTPHSVFGIPVPVEADSVSRIDDAQSDCARIQCAFDCLGRVLHAQQALAHVG